MVEKETKPQGRGVGLTVWLVGYSAAAVLAAVLLGDTALDELEYRGSLEVGFVLGLTAAVIQLVGVAGLWAWRRWGLTLVFGALAVDIVAAILVEAPFWSVSVRIFLVGGLAFMVVPHWDRMKG